MLSHRAHRRAAVVPDHVGPEPGRPRGRRVRRARRRWSRSCSSGSATQGPLSSTDVEPRAAIDWYWRPTNQVRAILEALGEAGILGIARREGNRRVYDLVERLFPAELLAERRLPRTSSTGTSCCRATAAHGLLGATGELPIFGGHRHGPRTDRARCTGRTSSSAGELVPVEVEGVRGPRFVRRGRAADARRRGGGGRRAAGRSDGAPASRSSRRSTRWPGTATCCSGCGTSTTSGRSTSRAAKRRWGYYVLPLLCGDRLRRPDRAADRPGGRARCGSSACGGRTGSTRSDAEPGFVDAFVEALQAHAAFADLRQVAMPRVARHRALAGRGPRAVLGVGGPAVRAPARQPVAQARRRRAPAGAGASALAEQRRARTSPVPAAGTRP